MSSTSSMPVVEFRSWSGRALERYVDAVREHRAVLSRRGLQPVAEPLAELFEREPEDVHVRIAL